jgi:AcrR family transcriptional regulator
MGLRQKQTNERCRRILESARKLIRRTGGTAFSMRTLADEANVSLATPYNLFGSKGGVLYALLNASLEKVDSAADTFSSSSSSGPVARVLEIAGIAADLYVRDATFYRPLMQFLLGARDVEHRPRLLEQSLRRWTRTVHAAVRHGLLAESVDVALLARQLMINFIGVVDLWVHEELDEEAFRAQSLYGSTLLVLANARPEARPSLLERQQVLERLLPRTLALPVEPARGTRLRNRQSAA